LGDILKKIANIIELDSEGNMKCPKCGNTYLHTEKIGVMPGILSSDDLSHRARERVITIFSCEMHDDKLMRIEVNHEGMNQSGIYLVDDLSYLDKISMLNVNEND
jgi:cell division protein ZapA (FtsZ GTPase activity inhibitor)